MTTLAETTRIARGQEKTMIVERLENGRIVLEEGARLNFIFWGTEGWADLARVEFELAGSNSELNFLAFIMGDGDARFPFETVSVHGVPQTKAHFNVKAALYGSSEVDFKGGLVLGRPAQLADVYLAHHTLLLSDKARARTVPALEIEADDVVAGHAATIGKVDKELMFYLKSRGIDGAEAEKMLVVGFFESQLAMVPDEEARKELRGKIIKALPFEYAKN